MSAEISEPSYIENRFGNQIKESDWYWNEPAQESDDLEGRLPENLSASEKEAIRSPTVSAFYEAGRAVKGAFGAARRYLTGEDLLEPARKAFSAYENR